MSVASLPEAARTCAPRSAGSSVHASALELRNLEVAYGPVKAVRGVSLAVRKERVVSILGSNGAGKTSVLRAISGIVEPSRGTIVHDGRDVTGADPSAIVRCGLCHVPEGREIFPLLSVRENLLMGAYTRQDRDAVAHDLEDMLVMFPILRDRLSQEAGLLSGGQQQMLAIARALMARPQLMLLDEPSLGLSPRLAMEIFETVVRINRERGTTVLVVEQNAHLALNAADDGYILENGRVVLEGACAELREKQDIQEFYLGIKDHGLRGERRWKRRKHWR